MVRFLSALIILGLLFSCSKNHKPDVVYTDRDYPVLFEEGFFVKLDMPVEDVWWTMIEVLEAYDWPIESAMEDAGMIRTEMMTMGTNRDKYACREWPGSAARVDQLRARLQIRIIGLPDGTSSLGVNAEVEGRYVTGRSGMEERVAGWFQCVSTGEIEGEVYDAVLSLLEPIWYDDPIFRRGVPARRTGAGD